MVVSSDKGVFLAFVIFQNQIDQTIKSTSATEIDCFWEEKAVCDCFLRNLHVQGATFL